ncbi:MAG: OmpH family outer membrane protein [Planctomycetes bacterium]|nr:OmpH family outer membrane protein [Planctomycetota bacterium]
MFFGVHRKRLLFLLMLPVLALPRGLRAAEDEKPALRIGVVNFARVFEEYKKTADINKKMGEKFDAPATDIMRRGQELAERQEKLRMDTRPKDDPGLITDIQRWNYDKARLDKEHRDLVVKRLKFNFVYTKQVLAEINEAIRRYAKSKDYDLVLKYQPPTEEANTYESFMRQFNANPVFYFSAATDITEWILQLLNTAYERHIELVPDETAKLDLEENAPAE